MTFAMIARRTKASATSFAVDSPTSQVAADQSEVIAFLADPASHGLHTPVRRIDTHGAIVFLAGVFAYKLKRAIRFPFMDFSTLEKRRRACEAEIEINRPGAPTIYLDARPITRSWGQLCLGGPGPAIDWVVQMRRFDDSQTLDHLAEAGQLTPGLLCNLTQAILASHHRAAPADSIAATAALGTYIDQNEVAFGEAPALFEPDRVALAIDRSRTALASCRELLLQRGQQGLVRRCHGDLHLRNLVLIGGAPVLFDAIEFDEGIATCDLLYDLAFLLMDLWQRGLRREANVVLNRYLWDSGDPRHLSGLAALPLFLSIRAALRAKIAAAALAFARPDQHQATVDEARRYFEFSLSFLDTGPPLLLAIGGLSGTGKSTLAAALAPSIGGAPGAVHLRSDIERKRMFGVADTERLPAAAYAPGVDEEVYARLQRKARLALQAGASVIVDAVHISPQERSAIAATARDLGLPFRGIWLEAPPPVLTERVTTRSSDASDADATVVRLQLDHGPGAIDWARIDAGQPAAAVLEQALADSIAS